MSYFVTVMSENTVLERVVFSYRDDALNFAEKRRRQGYIVTVKPITVK